MSDSQKKRLILTGNGWNTSEDQPSSYYRLLGLEDFEDDLAVIDAAAKKTTAYLHPVAAGPNRDSVQKLLSEVAKVRRTLLGSGQRL